MQQAMLCYRIMVPPGTESASIGFTKPNVDAATVDHFGREWSRFTQTAGWGDGGRLRQAFDEYFMPLPKEEINDSATFGDFGAGSGRWARFVAPQVKRLYVVEPSPTAMAVARQNLQAFSNVTFVEEPIGGSSMPESTLDVAYSIGVIHHIPDCLRALRDIRATLKPGGIFLGYLYYAMDNRPTWYRGLWRISDAFRAIISRLPARLKQVVTDLLAAVVYWPLARICLVLDRLRIPSSLVPLSQYADKTFYVMRNDSLDRFGTPLERRFSRIEIAGLLHDAGFDASTLVFSEHEPFWCFSVRNA